MPTGRHPVPGRDGATWVCGSCGKRAYDTWRRAAWDARAQRQRYGRRRREQPYWSRRCGCYHVGTRALRRIGKREPVDERDEEDAMTTMTDVPETRAMARETRPVFGDLAWIERANTWGHPVERLWGDHIYTDDGLHAVGNAVADAIVARESADDAEVDARKASTAPGDLFSHAADRHQERREQFEADVEYLEDLYADIAGVLEGRGDAAAWLSPPYGSPLTPTLDDPCAPWPDPDSGAPLREYER